MRKKLSRICPKCGKAKGPQAVHCMACYRAALPPLMLPIDQAGRRCACGALKAHSAPRCQHCFWEARRLYPKKPHTPTIDLTDRRCPNCKGLKSFGRVRCQACANARRTAGHKHPRYFSPSHQTPEFTAYQAIKQRCLNEYCPQYTAYGGRGITICAEWVRDYDAFYEHIGPKPSPTHTVDRINNDGNYEPGNVRWATQAEQQLNRRPCLGIKRLNEDGSEESISLSQASSYLALSYSALRGWFVEHGILPPEKYKQKGYYHAIRH